MQTLKIEPGNADVARTHLGKSFQNPSRAKQAFAEESEINNIIRKYRKTGLITHVAKYTGKYEELPGAGDFTTAMQTVANAETMFQDLPANLRNQFNNDPAEFLEFMDDDNNHDAIVEMGFRVATETGADEPYEGPPAETPPKPAETPAE